MSASQQGFLDATADRIGTTFDVATSYYADSKATGNWTGWVTRTHSSTLRSLEKSGHITINQKFWRGATVTRLK